MSDSDPSSIQEENPSHSNAEMTNVDQDNLARSIAIIPIVGVGEIHAGDDLVEILLVAIGSNDQAGGSLKDGDALVVTQKIVSKSEGRTVTIDPNDSLARTALVQSESKRVLRRRDELMIVETHHGFVCANAGVDFSNVPDGKASLLPLDSDRSAFQIRSEIKRRTGLEIGVIISDTFGRAWRQGVTDVAIGCSGIAGIVDLRGTTDSGGRELVATEVCVADELSSAADLVMGKARSIPAAIIRGIPKDWLRESSAVKEIVRPASKDLFR